MAGATGTDATANSSKDVRPADSRFILDALDLNVYGLSYHPDRATVHRLRMDNQVNPGLGLHYELVNSERGITFAEAGTYYDSGRSWAKFASLGYQFKLGERWRIGGAVGVLESQTYNRGAALFTMIPLVTYDTGPVKLNLAFFPRVPQYRNVTAFGFYIGIPLGRSAR